LAVTHWLLIGRHPALERERALPRQLILLALTFIAVIALVLALPFGEGSRNQVLTILGLILSGLVAFSSSTIVANLTAGVMLRVTKPFRTGDFIQVNEHFGRISERGLLDTEIQTEHRDLIALPNTYLITNPIKTVRASGTIVSTTLSLGYDVHHAKIEELLITAATSIDLADPFVIITELGDYAVT
jgi:small conductance mechanosensitive channel